MTTCFVGADPGSANYGYTVIDVTPRLNVKIVEIGMWQDLLTNLTDKPAKLPKSKRRKRDPGAREEPLNVQLAAFHAEWCEVFDLYPIQRVTCERFQTRGIKGKTIEAVSMMNGVLWQLSYDYYAEYDCITAATWKNQVNRYIELTSLYGQGLTPHSVDSFFIALHGALKYHDRKWSEVSWKSVAAALKEFQS